MAGLILVLVLVVSAAVPLIQFQVALLEYVFPNAELPNLSLFFLPAILALACAGLETLGRTARVCFLARRDRVFAAAASTDYFL